MINDAESVKIIREIENNLTPDNAGDKLIQAVNLFFKIQNPTLSVSVSDSLKRIRNYGIKAEIGWNLFEFPTLPNKNLPEEEMLQLILVERGVSELCYCCDRLDELGKKNYGTSTPVRFYINSICYYISSLFLVDAKKDSHKGLVIGGSAVLALQPVGLEDLLVPIKGVLEKPFSEKLNFGEIIQRRRNKQLVHGNFSIQDIEKLAIEASLRDAEKQFIFRVLLWELFHRCLILDLELVSIFSSLNFGIENITKNYLSKVG